VSWLWRDRNGAGAALRFLAATLQARAVVEVGTGAGVSGLCLLAGMAPDGVLTSIDIEPEHQRAARRAFTEAGTTAGRMRLIMGQALDVLPRLTDAATTWCSSTLPRSNTRSTTRRASGCCGRVV